MWTNTRIAQGTLCYPFQGTIRLDKLDVFGQLDDDDVSYFLIFGVGLLSILALKSLETNIKKVVFYPWYLSVILMRL